MPNLPLYKISRQGEHLERQDSLRLLLLLCVPGGELAEVVLHLGGVEAETGAGLKGGLCQA